eukprot:scaffold666991_cov59-Prasinocladus_malaysianus.AAC.1
MPAHMSLNAAHDLRQHCATDKEAALQSDESCLPGKQARHTPGREISNKRAYKQRSIAVFTAQVLN